MAKRKSKSDDASGKAVMIFIGLIVFIPFLIIATIHYYVLRARHGISDDVQRIFQTSSILPPVVVGTFVGSALGSTLIPWLQVFAEGGFHDNFVARGQLTEAAVWCLIVSPILPILIWATFHVACWVGATYLGVLVDRGSDKVVFPKDMANYSITDYLKLKFIRELGHMESVPLSEVKRITRQSQVHLYLHGPFGSRGIKFPSKQKRDECLVAIEEALGSRKTMTEFESAHG